jgi:maleylacetoacetate isomerase
MTLYHYWRSSCSWRVRWALQVKNISYQSQPIDLRIGEQYQRAYLQKNPQGTVPCLEVNGRYLADSLAIIEWLEEQQPQPGLLPTDPWTRAKVREFCGLINSIQAVQNLKVLQKFSANPAQKQLWAHHFIEQGLRSVEQRLIQHAGTYCFGGQLSAADLFLIPQVYNARRFGVNMHQFPHAARIDQHCRQLHSCEQAAPHNQPGAQP